MRRLDNMLPETTSDVSMVTHSIITMQSCSTTQPVVATQSMMTPRAAVAPQYPHPDPVTRVHQGAMKPPHAAMSNRPFHAPGHQKATGPFQVTVTQTSVHLKAISLDQRRIENSMSYVEIQRTRKSQHVEPEFIYMNR